VRTLLAEGVELYLTHEIWLPRNSRSDAAGQSLPNVLPPPALHHRRAIAISAIVLGPLFGGHLTGAGHDPTAVVRILVDDLGGGGVRCVGARLNLHAARSGECLQRVFQSGAIAPDAQDFFPHR